MCHGDVPQTVEPGAEGPFRNMTYALATSRREAHTHGDQSTEPSYPVSVPVDPPSIMLSRNSRS